MGLARKDELHRTLGIVHDGIQAVQIAEQQGRPFVGREPAGETDGEHIVPQRIVNGHDLLRRVVVAQGRIGQLLVDDFDEMPLQLFADVPDLFIAHLVNAFETFFVVMVRLEFLTEDLGMDGFPFLGRPRGIMHAVGHIAYI